MGGNDPEIYQSPYSGSVDQLIQNIALGVISGGAISPNPTLSGQQIAQQIGGTYDPETQQVIAPDGAHFAFNSSTGSYSQVGPASTITTTLPSNIGGPIHGGGNHGGAGASQTTTSAPVSPSSYGDQINSAYSSLSSSTYDNPYSAWSNMGNAFNQQFYNPETGVYENVAPGEKPPSQMTAEDYFSKYGSYLTNQYTPTSYNTSSYTTTAYNPNDPYNEFKYTAPEVKDLTPVSDAAWETAYNKRAGDVEADYRGRRQDIQDWVGQQGSSLSSGRRLTKDQEINNEERSNLDKIRAETTADQAQQKYDEAGKARDLGLEYGWKATEGQAGESRYGQEYNQGENRYAQEWGRDENKTAQDIAREEALRQQEWARDEGKYAYENAQALGREQMTAANQLNTQQQQQAWQEALQNDNNTMNMLQYFNQLLGTYAGQDSTAANYAASENQMVGAALGGLGNVLS